eukprot:1159714-Pelagomonas_calceolata.AAC.6
MEGSTVQVLQCQEQKCKLLVVFPIVLFLAMLVLGAFEIIYIAPLKALVRERVDDWGRGMCARLGKSLVELTGGIGRGLCIRFIA